jgi:uncharacterized iron-regulated membrane protein
MKLAPRTFQIYWDAHAWVGVMAALVLHVTFFMGTLGLFRHELNSWANPANARLPAGAPVALQPLLERLNQEQPLIGKERVAFLPEPTGLRAYWRAGREQHEFRYAPEARRLVPLRSDLGSFLFSMHYLGPIPEGVYLAGVGALGLFLVLITGLLIHWKDLTRQWFQFRPGRITRTWSSDLHKVLGVFGFPYQLLYAWTGAVLSLSFLTVQPAFVATLFHGDASAASAARGEDPEPPAPSHRLGTQLPDLDALVARAVSVLPELKPNWIGIEYVGDEHSSVSVYGDLAGLPFASAGVLMNAADGAVLGVSRPAASVVQRFEAWFFGLHYARFGGYGVKLLYALLGLATCALIVTGNLVWLERRDLRRAHAGNRWLERLTAGWCAGLLLATGSVFLANRALQCWPDTSAIEQALFWLVWAAGVGAAFLGRSSRRSAGFELLLAGILLAAAVTIDLVTSSGGLQDPIRRAVNAALALFAVASCAGGLRLSQHAADAPGAGRGQPGLERNGEGASVAGTRR